MQGKRITEPDDLLHAVMSEGLTDSEAAKYWAGVGSSNRWALHHAEAALRSDPDSVEALALWARELPRERKNERQAAYLAALERDPTHGGSLAYLASATMMDRPYESMEYAQRLLDVHPDTLLGYESMGLAYERVGDPDTAASYYEAGIEATESGFLRQALDRLKSGHSWIHPIGPAQTTTPPDDLPDAPAPSTPPATIGPPEEPPSRSPVAEEPAPQWETPKPVERYLNALDHYRAMTVRFGSVTGQPYRGTKDFGDYAQKSSNWIACRYMELAQQYLDAGHPEEAASVFEKASRQFPDDPLIQRRMEQRR